MTLKDDTKKEVHFVMNLFFYILSKNNLYSGLKDSKVFKFKGLRSFLRDLSSHSCHSRISCFYRLRRLCCVTQIAQITQIFSNEKRPMPFGTSLIFVV